MEHNAIDEYKTYLEQENETNIGASDEEVVDLFEDDEPSVFPNKKKPLLKGRSGIIILTVLILCLVIVLASSGYLIYKIVLQRMDDAVYDELAIWVNEPAPNITMTQTPAPIYIEGEIIATAPPISDKEPILPHKEPLNIEVPEDTPEPTETPVPEYEQLKTYSKNFTKLVKMNSDCVGWLEIKGTRINYPVVYSKDSQKYLDVGFDGKRNRNGTIYCTGREGTSVQNLTLYGHHSVSNGAMFGDLSNYTSERFFKNHKTINYSTVDGYDYTYTVFAAFTVSIKGRTFNYTQANFLNDKDLQNFVKTAQDMTPYNTGVTVPNGAHIITLSTCSGNDNRMVVMGYRN